MIKIVWIWDKWVIRINFVFLKMLGMWNNSQDIYGHWENICSACTCFLTISFEISCPIFVYNYKRQLWKRHFFVSINNYQHQFSF